MCGILGLVHNNKNYNEDKFVKSLKLLHHRGPDSMKKLELGTVTLDFCRLAIQDLTLSGDQPMKHPFSDIYIIFNGEIYNFKILMRELKAAGAEFRSNCDTEVILHAYHNWGWEKTLNKIDGMFSMAIYDQNKNKLFLARDRFGQKPLFYYKHGNTFLFASEIKSILEYTDYREIDLLSSLNPIFFTGLSPKNRTMFDRVHQFQPGEALEYDLNTKSFSKSNYFYLGNWVDPDLYKEISKLSESALLDLYYKELNTAIELHLISDAPLGSLFSAGLDSSVVTAVACQQRNLPIKLFYFQSELQDDMRYPQAFVNKFGGDLVPLIGQDSHYILKLPEMLYYYETVNKEEGPILGQLCSEARKMGFKTLLTGDAADEIFAGQLHHCSILTESRFHNSKLWRIAKKAINYYAPNSFFSYKGVDPRGTHYFHFPVGLNFYENISNILLHQGDRLPAWERCLSTYDFLGDTPERTLSAYLLDEIHYRYERFFIRSDRFGMMESIELRTPLVHPNIVKLTLNTPSDKLLGKTNFGFKLQRKHFFRKLAKKVGIPNEIIHRRKIGTENNSQPSIIKILRNWPLKRLGDLLKVPHDQLTYSVLNGYDPSIARSRFSFLATEILIRTFIDKEPKEKITQEFSDILGI